MQQERDTAGTPRRADIQGLRGVAVLLVVAFHVHRTLTGGYIGVDVFFVISGFVITGYLRGQVRRTGVVDIREFFARRVRRLLPLLSLTLTGTAALGVLLLSPLGASATTSKTAIAAALINANTFLSRQSADYFALPPDANALLHTWSLSVEEQFYLLLPVALIVGIAARRRVRALATTTAAAGVALLGLLSFALYAAHMSGRMEAAVTRLGFSSTEALGFYGAPTRAWEFLAGAFLALSAHHVRRIPGAVRDALGLVGLAGVVVCAAWFDDAASRSMYAMALPVVGSMAILAAGVDRDGIVPSILAVRPAVVIGDVSYGWYLFHWPLIVFAAANSASIWPVAAAAAASLGLALAAKGTIEDRFRSRARWHGRRLLKLVAVCVAVPVLVGLACLGVDRAWRVRGLDQVHRRHVPSPHGCNERLSAARPLGDAACTWAVPQAKGRIVLIGDSHAEMWAEAVIRAGNDLGYDVTVSVMSGCAIVDGTMRTRDGRADEECQNYVTRKLHELLGLRPAVVLLGASDAATLVDGGASWRSESGAFVNDVEGKAAVWRAGLDHAIAQLTASGIRTVIVRDVPAYELTPATCGRLKYLLAPSSCAMSKPVAAAQLERSRAVALEDAVAADNAGHVALMDPLPWLCGAGVCSTFTSGTWMYRDRDHLSVAGSQKLAPRVAEYLRSIGL